ncbi:MAG: starch-binding protein [Erysipelotrichaceae bacterium]|jgi:hypothetical protein|nr:starch-binding protein [Erysipelotrichaceae bacterium]
MKKLLLTLVPALMLLGSCAGAQPQVENGLFHEDTLAHEEIFGNIQDGLKKVRKNAINPGYPGVPTIGVQTKEADGKISLRFIAAVKLTDLTSTSASWTRRMYDEDGDVFVVNGQEKAVIECTKAYTSVYNNNVEYDMSAFDEEQGLAEASGYTHFLAYTILNIPKTTYKDYFLNAYLTLNGVKTDMLATLVDQSKQFLFPAEQTGYFLKGQIGGEPGEVLGEDDDYDTNPLPDGKVARFTTSLTSEDNFYLVYNHDVNTLGESKFIVYDSNCLSTNPYFFKDDGSTTKIKTWTTRDYVFYLNNSGEIDVETGFTLTYTANDSSSNTIPLPFWGFGNNNLKNFNVNISPKTNTQLIFSYDGNVISTASITPDEGANINESGYIVNGGSNLGLWFKTYDYVSYALWLDYPTDLSATKGGKSINLDSYSVEVEDTDNNIAQYEIPLEKGERIAFIRGYDVILEFPDCGSSKSYVALESGTHTFYVNKSYKLYVSGPIITSSITVYFTNSDGWSNVNLYAWKADANPEVKNAEWPGIAMTVDHYNEFDQAVYKLDNVDFNTYDYIIFNGSKNSYSIQTSNISLSDITTNGFYVWYDESADWAQKIGHYVYVAPETPAE